MRQTLFVVIAVAAGLGACAPVPAGPYGYATAPESAPAYGYYDGGYAPGPYYAQPGYAPYAAPSTAIVIGGERRFDRDDRFRGDRFREDRFRQDRFREEGNREDRRRFEGGGYRGNPNPPGREFARPQGPQGFGGGPPAPAPVAVRPAPVLQAVPPPPAGGRAFEQWNRTHVNASPSPTDNGPR